MHWANHSVLVTGATGLLGPYLVRRLLLNKAKVTCLVRDTVPASSYSQLADKVNTVRGNVCSLHDMERAIGEYEVDVVFHLAAQAIVGIANRNPLSTFESNIKGTWTVLEAARRASTVRAVVTASSDKAYGSQKVLPYNETTPLQGSHPYDVSKSCADLIAQTYAASYKLPVAIARCGNFYGGGDLNFNRIIPGTILSVLKGEAPVIRSDGKFVRDYIHVEDGAGAYMELASQLYQQPDNFRGEAFNFSNEVKLTVTELVELILWIMGSTIKPVILNQASNEIREQFLSTAKARWKIKWQPKYTLESGLAETINWYKSYFKNL